MPQKFIHEVADYLLEQEDFRDIAVIMPNKRASTYLSKALGEKAGKPIWSPKMMTINEWVDELTPERMISSTEGMILLYQAYCKVLGEKAESFSDFFKWGNMLRNDFNEIEVYLLNHKDVYRNLKDIKDIEEWSFDREKLSDNQKKYLNFWEQLGSIFEAYRDLLSEKKLQFFGGALRKLAENPALIPAKMEVKQYVFAGFNALSKAEEEIINFFVKENKAQIFWDVDQYYERQPNHEAAYFYRQFKNKWSKEIMNLPGDHLKNSLKKVDIIGVPQYTLQARLAASLLAEIPKEEHSETAVVLGDEKLLEPFLSGIPKAIEELNVTMGLSLRNTPLKALIDALFDIQINYFKYKSFGKGVYYKDWFNFARHPYVKKIYPELSLKTEQMFREAVQKNYSFLRSGFLENHGANAVLKFIKPWRKDHLHKDAFGMIQELLIELKKWVVEEELSFEGELIQVFEDGIVRFHDLLNEYRPEINLGVYRSLFSHFWVNEKIDYQGDPIEQIQVMGLLETRMLDFKNIIFVAMNEDVIPKKSRDQSMMPYDLKRYFQLPTRHERDAIFSHHFYRLLHRSENVTLIYNTENDDFGSGEKSRYITQLELELPQYSKNTEISQYNYFSAIEPTEEYQVKKHPELMTRIREYLQSGVSPTAFNTFFDCPLDFYYKYLLNLGEDEEVEESFTFSSFGTIIHDTLEALYEPYVNELLSTEIIDIMLKIYPKELKQQTLRKFDEEYLEQGANHVYFEAALVYIERFLQQEKKWLKDNECRIIALEKELTREMSFNVNGEQISIKLRGKADRIDEVNGDTIRIVDYKTGRVSSSDLLLYLEGDPKPKALQLAVYNLLYNTGDKKVTAGNISLQNPEEGFITVTIRENSSKRVNLDDSELLPLTESIVNDFVEKLLDMEEPFVHNPSAEYCNYCL